MIRAHNALTPKNPPMSGLDAPPKRLPALRLPGGWLTALIPLIWLAGLGAWVSLRWSHLPPMIPIHWDLTGMPDFWVRRSPSVVWSVIGTMGGICLAFIALAWLMLQQPPQTSRASLNAERAFRRQTALLIVASAWFVAFTPAFSLLPLPLRSFRAWMALFAATLLTGAVALVRAGIHMQRGEHTASSDSTGALQADEGRWYGPFYFNRRNRALFLPKRSGFGYTFNFANPWAWVLLAVLLGAAVALSRLLRH
jgi:uncharacterized membrane protein